VKWSEEIEGKCKSEWCSLNQKGTKSTYYWRSISKDHRWTI